MSAHKPSPMRPYGFHLSAVRSSIRDARVGSHQMFRRRISRHRPSSRGPSLPALLATRIERLRPRHEAPARPIGLIASFDAAPTNAPRHRRAAAPSADFDARRRWLIVAATGLFGLSVLMLGLMQSGIGGANDARPGTAVVVAPASIPEPAPLPQPQAAAPAPASERSTNGASNGSNLAPMGQGFTPVERIAGPWFQFFPGMWG
jgi:hypothetical protein